MSARKIISVTGADRVDFLQNLVTNDVGGLQSGLVWTALLTPQGKYLADFFMVPAPDAIWLDVAEALAPGLVQRLSMYKLRADVTLATVDVSVARGLGPTPEGSFADPRHPDLGWRAYDGREGDTQDWDALRVAHLVPESGIELVPNESYLLEMNFEALHGVDFRKGCYVGQEVTARMKHKTVLKKGLARVAVDGTASVGSDITNESGKPVGQLFTQSGGIGLAHIRFDRMKGILHAGGATITGFADATPKDP